MALDKRSARLSVGPISFGVRTMYKRQAGTTLQVAGGIILAVIVLFVVLPLSCGIAGLSGCAWLLSDASSTSSTGTRAPTAGTPMRRQRRSVPAKRPAQVEYEACSQWGVSEKYILKLASDYRSIKETAQLPKDEMLSGALDACIEEVEDTSHVPLCRDCVRQILDKLFEDSTLNSEMQRPIPATETNDDTSGDQDSYIDIAGACEPWKMSDRYVRRLKKTYEKRRSKVSETAAQERAKGYCKKRPAEELDACLECMDALVRSVYSP